MLPHEREMVERLADEPFVLLGINSDRSRSALKKIMKDEKITWPNIYGGPTGDNAIAKAWNVTGWPTIYILDHKGVIRYRDLRDQEMEEAVVALLEKMKADGKADGKKKGDRSTKPDRSSKKKDSAKDEEDE